MTKSKILMSIGALVAIGLVAFLTFGPGIVDKSMNTINDQSDYTISQEAADLHETLQIVDWHSDSLLWKRDFMDRNTRGHVDLPRLQEGNFTLQVLTTVTKTPSGLNYEENDADSDDITTLAVAQLWPVRTWDSLLQRALYQSERLHGYVEESEGAMRLVTSRSNLMSDSSAVAVMLGTEGSHPLEGKVENIDVMFDAGFRMFGITHFFDNDLSGSLHGVKKDGLTDFGRAAVQRFDELEVIIDLAHISEKGAWQVTEMSSRPQVVSHTGFKGHCETPRNFNDDLMKAIAAKGGIIAVGFWPEVVCGDTPDDVADAIKYGIDLVGVDHVVLGSDWDGVVKAIPSNQIVVVTEALLRAGISHEDIRKVMGGNSLRFMSNWLPG